MVLVAIGLAVRVNTTFHVQHWFTQLVCATESLSIFIRCTILFIILKDIALGTVAVRSASYEYIHFTHHSIPLTLYYI